MSARCRTAVTTAPATTGSASARRATPASSAKKVPVPTVLSLCLEGKSLYSNSKSLIFKYSRSFFVFVIEFEKYRYVPVLKHKVPVPYVLSFFSY